MSSSREPKIIQRTLGLQEASKRFYKSVWLFPVALLLPLFVLTALSVSGSSVGTFHDLLYGNGHDKNLVLNKPEPIRSDEWLVNTQQIIAQSKNHFAEVNQNIGHGENLSTTDVPYKDWSIIFKPHNLVFFVLPLAHAFAFKWWFMGYLLIISCYFFVLQVLPGKRRLAAGLSVALFFSAFVQWWYAYGTLGSLYYSLFIATTVMKLARQPEWRKKLAWSALLAYLISCFALVLYPPFQIACGLVLVAFLLGFVIEEYAGWSRREFIRNTMCLAAGVVIGIMIVAAFVLTRLDVVKTTNDTVYPGRRSLQSGKFFPIHFMSSQLGYQFISQQHTAEYLINGKSTGHTNQSEASNFLLLAPFLFAPAVLLLSYEYRHRRKIPFDWTLLALCLLFIVFILQLFVPAFTPFSKLFLLNKVGDDRVLIGTGLLNLTMIVVLIRNLSNKKFELPKLPLAVYVFAIFVIELLLGLHAHRFTGFISFKRVVVFSIPLPLVTYLLLRKSFGWAVFLYTLFSIFISFHVNPLYRGLSTLTDDPLSKAVQQIGATSNKLWISDGGYLENIPSMNGKRSLVGVYDYPQTAIWKTIPGASAFTYNRYAHVGFVLSNNLQAKTSLDLLSHDSFQVKTNACSSFLSQQHVGFMISSAVLHSPCSRLLKTIHYPLTTLYIYKLQPS